jgi:hypothetical protein
MLSNEGSGQMFMEAPSLPKSTLFVATLNLSEDAFVRGLSHASLVRVKYRAGVWDPSEKPHVSEGTSTKWSPITVNKTPPPDGTEEGATLATEGFASYRKVTV